MRTKSRAYWKPITSVVAGGLMAATVAIGVPTQAQAAQVTTWDCRSYITKIDKNTARRDTWCTKQVSNTLFPVYGRVKVSSVILKGHFA